MVMATQGVAPVNITMARGPMDNRMTEVSSGCYYQKDAPCCCAAYMYFNQDRSAYYIGPVCCWAVCCWPCPPGCCGIKRAVSVGSSVYNGPGGEDECPFWERIKGPGVDADRCSYRTGKYLFYVRSVDPAGNPDPTYDTVRYNMLRWDYVQPLPVHLIVGGCLGVCLLAWLVYMEIRRRKRKAAMQRYAIKRMRRKFKASQKDAKDGKGGVDWKSMMDDDDGGGGKKKKVCVKLMNCARRSRRRRCRCAFRYLLTAPSRPSRKRRRRTKTGAVAPR